MGADECSWMLIPDGILGMKRGSASPLPPGNLHLRKNPLREILNKWLEYLLP